jgi:uncharacterized protein (DUF433 family)
MSLAINTDPVPLQTDRDGVVRVGQTRVTLDTIVVAFQQGATPEEIAQQYPTLALSDVYAVIGFYLRRRPQVEAYLEEGRRQAEAVRQQDEPRSDLDGIRDRLLARRSPNR